MTILHRRSVLAGAAAATLAAPAIANAQADWPKGPIKIIVPFPPGGSTDPVARIIQAKLIELNRLECRGRQQAGRHRRGRRLDRRQVAARRPDLADHVRQPHPQSGLRRRRCPTRTAN